MLLGGAGVLGDVCIKRAASAGRVDLGYFAAGLAVYIAAAVGWLVVMRSTKLIVIGPLYAASTILLLTLAGLAFGERIRMTDAAGIGCALAAVVLLARFGGA